MFVAVCGTSRGRSEGSGRETFRTRVVHIEASATIGAPHAAHGTQDTLLSARAPETVLSHPTTEPDTPEPRRNP